VPPQPRRIYLDNAATSWPKPPAVVERVHRYLAENGAPAGRGAYREALEVESAVRSVRSSVARLIGADQPESLVFTANGTDSLNLALHGILREGDHVVTTAAEHNSVLRPLMFERQMRNVQFDVVPCDGDGWVDPNAVAAAIQPETRLIAVTHASNVTGVVQPLAEIGRIAQEHDILLLVDAAQTLGHIEVDVRQPVVDLLAGSAHKGLLGILGLGILYVRPGLESQLAPWRQGGTGTQSDQIRQPAEMPHRYESGNLNVPAILGLGAAIEFLQDSGLPKQPCPADDRRLAQRLVEGLRAIQGVRVIGHRSNRTFVPVVSITLPGWRPADAAAVLDAQFGIQVRAGFHCAPLIHGPLATREEAGTLRFSFGPFNTPDDVEVTLDALSQMVSQA